MLCLAAWRSGSNDGRINQVALHRDRLILGWVIVLNQPKCADALRLESKGKCGSFHLWINVWVTGKAV